MPLTEVDLILSTSVAAALFLDESKLVDAEAHADGEYEDSWHVRLPISSLRADDGMMWPLAGYVGMLGPRDTAEMRTEGRAAVVAAALESWCFRGAFKRLKGSSGVGAVVHWSAE